MSHYKPDPNKNVTLTIDGLPVTVPEGTRILEAAREVGVRIPTLCDHPDLCKRAVCRICVVECDGRGKLLAACANDVWEDVSVVTHNARLLSIRKTIIELLLADHPQECLTCIRSGNCDLQKLAADFGIRESFFGQGDSPHNTESETIRRPPVTENGVLIRDMDKCVKCGRCVEACQEVQSIRAINSSRRGIHYGISAPYGEALADGPCVFCGQCAGVCPVGAIYEHEQTAEVWAALRDRESHAVAQFDPASSTALNDDLGLPAGTVSPGKTVTALLRLGFAKVYNSQCIVNAITAAENNELLSRIEKSRFEKPQLPMITGCSAGVFKFVEDHYPDLTNNLYRYKSPQQILRELIDAENLQGANPDKITIVSVAPCLAQKCKPHSENSSDAPVLTVRELARIFTQAGVNFTGLPESPFDTITEVLKPPLPTPHSPLPEFLTINGFAAARTVLDSIRRGERNATGGRDASMVRILGCPHADRPLCPFSGSVNFQANMV